MRSSLGGRVTEGILVSRRVDDKVLAGDGEPATLEALKEENQQHRLASDQLHAILDQGLFMARLELDGTLVHVNRSALEVPGFTREQVFKRLFWEFGWWNRAPEIQKWIKDAVRQAASGVPFRKDSRYFWSDGTEHNVDFACIPIRDAGGKVVVLVATGMDITERVHAEEPQRALEEQRLRSDALAVLDRTCRSWPSTMSPTHWP
jgi:PAS domain S-box-containing protein